MNEKIKYKRLQVEIPEAYLNNIDEIKDLLGLRTRKEYVDASLTAFAWMIRERMRGRVIASVDISDGSYDELIMPCLMLPEIYATKHHSGTSEQDRQPARKAELR